MLNGERIRVLMQNKELTGRELASRVGVSDAMMSYILQGQRDPNVQILVRMSAELECTLDELVVK